MSEIRRVILRRGRNAIITIFGIMTLNFFLIQGVGDPVLLLTPRDPKVPCEMRIENGIRFGVYAPGSTCDNPIPLDTFSRFLLYLQNTFTGNWGMSYQWKQPVFDMVINDLTWTLVLVGAATVITILLGMLIGAVSAARRGQAFDLVMTSFGLFFYGMPVFWLALVLQLGFTDQQVGLNWWPTFPVGGEIDPDLRPFNWQLAQIMSVANHLILPSATLALAYFAGVSLIMRNSLIDVMTEDYVVTARAKGLAERMILRRHVLPNGMPPMVTLIALDMAFIFGGAYQIEYVFSYEGIGWRTISAIYFADFPVIQFIVVMGGVAVVVANFFADLLLVKIDPRIKIA